MPDVPCGQGGSRLPRRDELSRRPGQTSSLRVWPDLAALELQVFREVLCRTHELRLPCQAASPTAHGQSLLSARNFSHISEVIFCSRGLQGKLTRDRKEMSEKLNRATFGNVEPALSTVRYALWETL